MSEKEEKETGHNVIVRLLSERPITYAAAVFALAKSIDVDILDEHDLIIIGYDFNESEPGTHIRKPSAAAKKIGDFAARSPGALGDLYAFIKNYKWHQIYIGFAAVVLGLTLLYKFFIRAITGGF